MSEKLKLALYWAASCGGCEIAVIEIGEKLLDLIEAADIVFWPAGTDFKYKDVEAMPDGYIDVCLFNGAIRTAENEHIAKLLRKKSKVMVAFGSCAHEGCIPGLANLTDRQGVFTRAYLETPSTDNPACTLPQTLCTVPEGELELPAFYDTVKTLAQTVKVDYTVPGCPPVAEQVWKVLQTVISGDLPEPGAIIGADSKTVCDECERIKGEKKVKRFVRPHEVIADPEGVDDQGAKLLGVVMSLIDSEADPQEVERLVNEIVDPVGTFYRFSLADSLLQTVKSQGE